MNNLKACRHQIGVTPFPDSSVKIEVKKTGQYGVASIQNKVSLVELKVLVEDAEGLFKKGSTVFVRGDLYVHPWAKVKYTLPEVSEEFILLPVNVVDIVKEPEQPTAQPRNDSSSQDGVVVSYTGVF